MSTGPFATQWNHYRKISWHLDGFYFPYQFVILPTPRQWYCRNTFRYQKHYIIITTNLGIWGLSYQILKLGTGQDRSLIPGWMFILWSLVLHAITITLYYSMPWPRVMRVLNKYKPYRIPHLERWNLQSKVTWWRHGLEIISALLALCDENLSIDSPHGGPV